MKPARHMSSFVGKKAKSQETLPDMKPNIPFNIKSARWGQFMAEVLTRRTNATFSDQGPRSGLTKSGGECWDIAQVYTSHFRFTNGISLPTKRWRQAT